MKERDWGERKMIESEETEEIKTFPFTLTSCKDSRPCPTVSQYQLDTLEAFCLTYEGLKDTSSAKK